MHRVLFVLFLVLSVAAPAAAAEFRSAWPATLNRAWIGPEYWSNPLQDWRIRNGRLECFVAGGDRNVFLLTREIQPGAGDLAMSIRLGRLEGDTRNLQDGFAGFRLGVRGTFRDYRDSAVRGVGLNVGLNSDGRLFIGELASDAPRVPAPLQNLELRVTAKPAGERFRLLLQAFGSDGRVIAELSRDVVDDWIIGGVALVCTSGAFPQLPPAARKEMETGITAKPGTVRGGTMRFWFRDWQLSGSKVAAHDDRTFGPILFAMHTLSRRALKLTAQMAPVEPGGAVALQVRTGSNWRTVASSAIDPLSRTATFRIPNWDDKRDTPYRVRYRQSTFEGTIRRDPKDKPQIVVAAFTGNNDLGFPHADVVRNVSHFRPDLLFFTGDQIYERVGEYGTQRQPLEAAALDYLRKWYQFGWEYRDLLKDIPSVALPDDHDVYHGNLWGGRAPR